MGAKDNLERSTKNEKTRSYVIYLAEVFKGGKSIERSGAQQVRGMKSGFKDEF